MRVLVTGQLGYIGSVMVPMLLRSGQEMIGRVSARTFGPRYQRIGHIQKLIADGVLAGDLRRCPTADQRPNRDFAMASD